MQIDTDGPIGVNRARAMPVKFVRISVKNLGLFLFDILDEKINEGTDRDGQNYSDNKKKDLCSFYKESLSENKN